MVSVFPNGTSDTDFGIRFAGMFTASVQSSGFYLWQMLVLPLSLFSVTAGYWMQSLCNLSLVGLRTLAHCSFFSPY